MSSTGNSIPLKQKKPATIPVHLAQSPVFLLATLWSARAAKDTGLETAAHGMLADLGIKIEFVPNDKKRGGVR